MVSNQIEVSALFVLAWLGHQIGDFLLQSTWMALNKTRKDLEGLLACTVHVTLYTLAVSGALILGGAPVTPIVALVIFVPHWVIDHWSLGELWMQVTHSRTRKKLDATKGLEREYAFAFYAPVYINVDNTIHFICLWLTIRFMLV